MEGIDGEKYRLGRILMGLIRDSEYITIKDTSVDDPRTDRYVEAVKAANSLFDDGIQFVFHSFDSVAERDSFFSSSLSSLLRLRTIAIVDSATPNVYIWNGVSEPASYVASNWVNLMPPSGGLVSNTDIQDVLNSLVFELIDRTGLPQSKNLMYTTIGGDTERIDIENFYTPPSVTGIFIDEFSSCKIDYLEARDNYTLCYSLYGAFITTSVSIRVIEWRNGVATKSSLRFLDVPKDAESYNVSHIVEEVTLVEPVGIADSPGKNGIEVSFSVVDTYGDTYTYDKMYSFNPDNPEDKVYLYYSASDQSITPNLDIERRRGVPFVQSDYDGHMFLTILYDSSYPDIDNIVIGDEDLRGSFRLLEDTYVIGGTTYAAVQSCVAIEAVIEDNTVIR